MDRFGAVVSIVGAIVVAVVVVFANVVAAVFVVAVVFAIVVVVVPVVVVAVVFADVDVAIFLIVFRCCRHHKTFLRAIIHFRSLQFILTNIKAVCFPLLRLLPLPLPFLLSPLSLPSLSLPSCLFSLHSIIYQSFASPLGFSDR